MSGLHHVIVGWETYDERVLRSWLRARVEAIEAGTWRGIASQLGRLGQWEFDGLKVASGN